MGSLVRCYIKSLVAWFSHIPSTFSGFDLRMSGVMSTGSDCITHYICKVLHSLERNFVASYRKGMEVRVKGITLAFWFSHVVTLSYDPEQIIPSCLVKCWYPYLLNRSKHGDTYHVIQLLLY